MHVVLHRKLNNGHAPQHTEHTIFQILNRGGVDGTKLIGILLVIQNTNQFLSKKRTRALFPRVEIDLIVKWLWYFIKHYENSDEAEFSMVLLNYYLNEKDQSLHFGELEDIT